MLSLPIVFESCIHRRPHFTHCLTASHNLAPKLDKKEVRFWEIFDLKAPTVKTLLDLVFILLTCVKTKMMDSWDNMDQLISSESINSDRFCASIKRIVVAGLRASKGDRKYNEASWYLDWVYFRSRGRNSCRSRPSMLFSHFYGTSSIIVIVILAMSSSATGRNNPVIVSRIESVL